MIKRLVAVLAALGLALGGYVVGQAQSERVVGHVTVQPGDGMTIVARRLCPQSVGAAQQDLARSNNISATANLQVDRVLHYHPDACTGGTTTTSSTTTTTSSSTSTSTLPASTSTSTSTLPASTSTTTTTEGEPTTTETVASTTTVAPTTSSSSTTTTVPATTTTEPPASSTSTTTTSPSTSTTVAPTTTSGGGGGQGFSETFGSPASLTRFTWQSFHGVEDPFEPSDAIELWRGDHDHNCGNPDTTQRDVHLHGNTGVTEVAGMGGLVWYCNDHVMTSMQTVGYAHVDFTPKQSFNNVSRVCWDQNNTEMGGRKWTQVTVVPDSIFYANGGRMEYVLHELQGVGNVGSRGIPLSGDTLLFASFSGSSRVLSGQSETEPNFSGYVEQGKVTRRKVCLVELTTNAIAVEFYGRTYTGDTCSMGGCDRYVHVGARFPEGPAHVIFQDVTYDGPKGDHGPYDPLTDATWHWDDILIEVA